MSKFIMFFLLGILNEYYLDIEKEEGYIMKQRTTTDEAFLYCTAKLNYDSENKYTKEDDIIRLKYIMFLIQTHHAFVYGKCPFEEQFYIDALKDYIEFDYEFYNTELRRWGARIDIDLSKTIDYVFDNYWNMEISDLDYLITESFPNVSQAKDNVSYFTNPCIFLSNDTLLNISRLHHNWFEENFKWLKTKTMMLEF